jgi:hypothetical protein
MHGGQHPDAELAVLLLVEACQLVALVKRNDQLRLHHLALHVDHEVRTARHHLGLAHIAGKQGDGLLGVRGRGVFKSR